MTTKTQHEYGICNYGVNRYEVQDGIRRVAVFDHIEDAQLFIAVPALLAALERYIEKRNDRTQDGL